MSRPGLGNLHESQPYKSPSMYDGNSDSHQDHQQYPRSYQYQPQKAPQYQFPSPYGLTTPQQASKMWKSPQYVSQSQIPKTPEETLLKSPSLQSAPVFDSTHSLPFSPESDQHHHPYDFPLLYHLLMLQNYCYHGYQDFYNMEYSGNYQGSPAINHLPESEPLDLSFKCEEDDTKVSGFLKENNISYDESIKHNEEVEVVLTDDENKRIEIPVHKKQEESVKDFVERKIKEYKKSDKEFKMFVSESNIREKDIKKKMSQIKEKYSLINNKIKKLEEKRQKIKVDKSTNSKPQEANEDNCKEPNNNDLSITGKNENTNSAMDNIEEIIQEEPKVLTLQTKSLKRKLQIRDPENSLTNEKEPNENDTRLYLESSQLCEGTRVLLRLDAVMHPGKLTDIVPPDIYGVVVDKERGNKPHVFSTEDLLQRAVYDIRPVSVSELRLGSRVCVFWSSKMNYLHPGLVTGFVQEDPDYVIVSTDDGDTRDVHFDQIRFLPNNFSTLDSPHTPQSSTLPGFKIRNPSGDSLPHLKKYIKRTKDESVPSSDVTVGRWCWADVGRKANKKSKLLIHDRITDGKETIKVGDYAIFLNNKSDPNFPYLGKILSMWETRSKMNVRVSWLYHHQEVEGVGVRDIKVNGAVFESDHCDDNIVQTITRRCQVSPWSRAGVDDEAEYLVVGHYDPVENVVKMKPGLLQ